MPHPRNVDALAELLYRAEHWEIGITPPFERLPQARREEYRRKAEFLSARGVLVPSVVAAEIRVALAPRATTWSDAEVQATLEGIARGEAA